VAVILQSLIVSRVLIAVLLWLAVGCSDKSTTSNSSKAGSSTEDAAAASDKDNRFSLVMIPKATQASFWNAVRRGAERAAQEADVDLTWKGPNFDNDRAAQKQVAQQFINEGVDGILLAPTDSKALLPEAQAAMAAKIPLLIFDSALEGEQGKDFIGFIATDNLAAGRLGGKHLMELVGKGGKTVLFRHMEGQESTSNRERGALEEMKAADAEVLVENRYSGSNMGEAQRTALNLIDTIRQADGIFASNQTSSEGMLVALQNNGLAGKIKFVGFDYSPILAEALEKGEIDALVLQDPVQMGYKSVIAMVDHLKGKPIEPVVATACRLVTRQNMNDPEIKPLLE
jgi:ribose transport system substrate-binding protein